ncbi:MAG: radical SAM protein [Candidatus Latescibacterota bacterium]
MRILVVQTNTNRLLMPTPLGASLVAARLRRDGHAVRFLDLMHAPDPEEAAATAAHAFRPELACFSIRNRDNMSLRDYADPMPQVARVVAAVHRAEPAPSLLGGTAFTTYPARILAATAADWGIAGDDLEVVASFVGSVAQGAPDLSTAGLVYRGGDGTVVENPFRVVGYRDVRFDNWDLIDVGAYRRAYWQAGVVTRSGCSEECVFCDTFRTFGREVVLREPEAVAEDLLALKSTGRVRSVFLVDAGFNRPLDHAKEVLRQVIRRGAQLQLHAILDPGPCDPELLTLYRRAGGASFMLFAESLSDTVLHELRKPFGAAEVRRDAAALRRAGIGFFFMPTLGSPGETPETVRQTLEGAWRLGATYVDFGIGWRIQPRTALRERAVREGLLSADDDCYEARFYVSPETPRPWLEEQVKACRRRHPLAALHMAPFLLRLLVRRPWTWQAETPPPAA